MIGLGGMAEAHRKAMGKIECLQLGALCDVDEDILNKIGDEEAIRENKRYTKMEELVADPEVDAIISIVPNHLHAYVLKLCIQHKKPIMAEKPFTLNFDEAEELAALYEKQPIPCMVGFSYRYIPSFRYTKKLLEKEKIGSIRHIAVRYLQSFGAPLFEVPYLWRFNKALTGTGALGDLGSHMIDSARFFVGEFHSLSALTKTFVQERKDPISGEMVKVEVDDYASFQAVLEHDVIGNFVTTRHAVGSGNQLEITLYGDFGTIHLNCERPNEVDICVKDAEDKAPAFKTIQVPDGYEKQQLQDFADLIRGQSAQEMPNFYDGYQNQKVLEKIIQSAESGQFVKVN